MRTRQISIETIHLMEELRASHMSNLQIAKELHIAYGTVRKYLGPQPSGLRADPGTFSASVTDTKPMKSEAASPPPSRASSLQTVDQVKTLRGTFFQYAVSSQGGVSLRGPQEISTDKAGLETLITEMMDVYTELCAFQE